MITKKEVSEALALSCVESYFLPWLKQYYDVVRLYGSSFVSLRQAFDDFAHGAEYQSYTTFPRLQDLAEVYGVVVHEYRTCTADEALESIQHQTPTDLWLMRVNQTFFAGFKRSAWREDHYICVDKNLHWINQYPLSEGTFDEVRFADVYDGAVCVYKVGDLTAVPPDTVRRQYGTQAFGAIRLPDSPEALVSAVGILRMSRKRLEKYYESDAHVRRLLHEEVAALDKLYFLWQLYRLKERDKEERDREEAYGALHDGIAGIADLEKKIAEALNR